MASFLSKFTKNAAVANPLMLDTLKKGRTPDQCKCIDFFYIPDSPKKGCMKKLNRGWTIDDYCAHVQSIVNSLNLKQRAIEKIGLDESQISEIPPILLSTFVKPAPADPNSSKPQDGYVYDDTRYVTNKYSVTWIFFSATQLYTYTYQFNTMTDDTFETTRDFFYSDITCIRTMHEVEEHIVELNPGCGCLSFFKKKESKFVHRNKHWDHLQITVPNDDYSFYCKTNDTIEQSIQAAKAMIREKKQA